MADWLDCRIERWSSAWIIVTIGLMCTVTLSATLTAVFVSNLRPLALICWLFLVLVFFYEWEHRRADRLSRELWDRKTPKRRGRKPGSFSDPPSVRQQIVGEYRMHLRRGTSKQAAGQLVGRDYRSIEKWPEWHDRAEPNT